MMAPDSKPYLVAMALAASIVMIPAMGAINFGEPAYTWTDRVYITITAPDFDFDRYLIDQIGDKNNPIRIYTTAGELEEYRLVETGTSTGIFTGWVTLTGFEHHDADGDGRDGDASGMTGGAGPTGGTIAAENEDNISVSFEYSRDHTMIDSAPIRWNTGAVSWLQDIYSVTDNAVLHVTDPDMNLDPGSLDSFKVDVFSSSDVAGIDLVVTETGEASGVFEGTVTFTDDGPSSGHRLLVDTGDSVTAEYHDHTLPNPYGTADDITVTAEASVGQTLPPLYRINASNPRATNAFGASLPTISIGQQVQIAADITNNQDTDQPFTYIVHVQDEQGVTVSLSWIQGSLVAGQSLTPSQSWTPSSSGPHKATIFVWESITDPVALSESLELVINVS